MSRHYETCPYNSIPRTARWADAVGAVEDQLINPHAAGAAFRIDAETRIASAGSCFAQTLSRVLKSAGFNYMCVEPPPPWLPDEDHEACGYGSFSARYGNIYTARQLLQLFQRAFGTFTPEEPAWVSPEGRVFDPFRPRIQPDGFDTVDEMLADRAGHLQAVRSMLETLDVLVFTLGLTECWRSRSDGAVFPVAPGCGAGTFDAAKHEFHNCRVDETISDLNAALALLHDVNPAARVILTVSPVALQATMTEQHVLQATVYSKSALRVVAEEVRLANPRVTYFASYEIATATLNNARYFAADKRSVTEACVDHVMACFFEVFTDRSAQAAAAARQREPRAARDDARLAPVRSVCDEDAIAEALITQASRGTPVT